MTDSPKYRRARKLAIWCAAIGLATIVSGAVLLSQRASQIQNAGQVVHAVGMMVTLAGLAGFLIANFAERGAFAPAYDRAGALMRRPRVFGGRFMVVLTRVFAVLLAIAATGAIGIAMFSVFSFRPPRVNWGYLLMQLLPAIVGYAASLALWLLADITQRINEIAYRQVDQLTDRSHKENHD